MGLWWAGNHSIHTLLFLAFEGKEKAALNGLFKTGHVKVSRGINLADGSFPLAELVAALSSRVTVDISRSLHLHVSTYNPMHCLRAGDWPRVALISRRQKNFTVKLKPSIWTNVCDGEKWIHESAARTNEGLYSSRHTDCTLV